MRVLWSQELKCVIGEFATQEWRCWQDHQPAAGGDVGPGQKFAVLAYVGSLEADFQGVVEDNLHIIIVVILGIVEKGNFNQVNLKVVLVQKFNFLWWKSWYQKIY